MDIFKYFLFTIFLELPIVLIAYRSQLNKVFIVTVLLNLFTWPLITLLYTNSNIHLLILEFFVFIIEGIGFKIYFNGKWRKAMLISFLANGFSLSVGFLISYNIPI